MAKGITVFACISRFNGRMALYLSLSVNSQRITVTRFYVCLLLAANNKIKMQVFLHDYLVKNLHYYIEICSLLVDDQINIFFICRKLSKYKFYIFPKRIGSPPPIQAIYTHGNNGVMGVYFLKIAFFVSITALYCQFS